MTLASSPWGSVIIPIKDERDNLSPLTEQLLKALTSVPLSRTAAFEILYVDDGSTDGSSALLDILAANYKQVNILHFDRNYGQTSAFDAGFRHAKGELLITMDGDLQLDPADILTLLPLTSQYDLVCGWRKDRHDHVIKKISSRIANRVRSLITGDSMHDTGCSLKIFRRAVGTAATFRRHAPFLSRLGLDVWVHRNRDSGSTLSTCTWCVEVWSG